MSRRTIWSTQLLAVLLCALALKLYYSTATADELRWILAPTTALVELLTRRSFEFESLAGYTSSDHSFVIAAPCAGVNFLITSFLMLGLWRLWRERFENVSWRFIPMAAVLSYVTTIVANTARICIALQLRNVEIGSLTGNQVHRLEGIIVYFGFLLLLFTVIERSYSAKQLLFPLLVYYAITLGIPLANGSWRQGAAFFEHFAFVLVLPLVVVLPVALFHRTYKLRQNLHVTRSGAPS